MVNQFKFFVGSSKQDLDENVAESKGQMLMTTDTSDIYYDSANGRNQISFFGDWNVNDKTSHYYIQNRTHYVDENGNVVPIPKKFLPAGKALPDIFFSDGEAIEAIQHANDMSVDGSDYYIGQLLLVFDVEGNPQWKYVTKDKTLGVLGSGANIDSLVNVFVMKEEVVTDWYNVTQDQYDSPVSYGAVRQVIGEIENVLKTV